MKKAISLLLTLAIIFSLAACGGLSSFENDVATLVQGDLDALYLGRVNEDYLDLVSGTKEECEQAYQAGLEAEAEYLAYYFDIEILDDELKAELVALLQAIYSHTRFTVGAVSKLDDSTYAVKLNVAPINIIEQATENFDEDMADFYAKYENADIEAMTDEGYAQYDKDWARGILTMLYKALPELEYRDEQSIAIQVVKDSEGFWSISDSDLYTIDTLIIYYP